MRASGPTITRSVAPPLVTVRRNLGLTDTSSAYAAQERLLGTKVYEIPDYKGTRFATGEVKLVGACTPGTTAFLYLPRVNGRARLADGIWHELSATRRPGINTNSAMVQLGTVPKSGVVLIEVNFGDAPQGIPPKGSGRLPDRQALAKVVRRLRASGATDVKAGGHSIRATLPPGSKGYAVVPCRGCPAGSARPGTERLRIHGTTAVWLPYP